MMPDRGTKFIVVACLLLGIALWFLTNLPWWGILLIVLASPFVVAGIFILVIAAAWLSSGGH